MLVEPQADALNDAKIGGKNAEGTIALEVPMTQTHIADALGLSLVHTNKTLRRFNSRGLTRWRGRIVELLDVETLRSISDYDEDPSMLRPLF